MPSEISPQPEAIDQNPSPGCFSAYILCSTSCYFFLQRGFLSISAGLSVSVSSATQTVPSDASAAPGAKTSTIFDAPFWILSSGLIKSSSLLIAVPFSKRFLTLFCFINSQPQTHTETHGQNNIGFFREAMTIFVQRGPPDKCLCQSVCVCG